jgi:hypothetical protein
LIEAVADSPEKLVSVETPAGSTMSHVRELAIAPLVQVGVVITTSTGAPPSTWLRTPDPSKFRVPLLIVNGVPTVPPVTSAPGAEIE